MARRRRKRHYRTLLTCTLIGVAAICGWRIYTEYGVSRTNGAARSVDSSLTPLVAQPIHQSAGLSRVLPAPLIPKKEEEGVVPVAVAPTLRNEPAPPTENTTQEPPSAPASPNRAMALLETGKESLTRGDLITARDRFTEALALDSAGPEAAFLRTELTRIGEETIFSSRIVAKDPLVERYIIQPGDSLAKIAARYLVPADLLATINNIPDKNLIRAGQTIKVIKGPFRAVVERYNYVLDLYLDKTLVRYYPVGLGTEGSTPTGEWQVATKLVNPTYYPPRGGDILAADDPANPLGERWIGLVGVSGECQGMERYGIHGTIEPDSIGRNASMGCIRLHNPDVEALYQCLVEKYSTVTVR